MQSRANQIIRSLFGPFAGLLGMTFVLALAPVQATAQVGGIAPRVTAPGAVMSGAVMPGAEAAWRLRILDSAVVNDSVVRLGDIAIPLGNMPLQEWRRLAAMPLWASPDVSGKPLQINKQRLQTALREALGDLADSCLLPNSLAIQLGGSVLREEDLRELTARQLGPQINLLGGRCDLTDFRLPPYTFLAHSGQQVIIEPTSIAPGRINLRFALQEMDGAIIRRFNGSVFMDLWMNVPCPIRPINRGEAVTPDLITFVEANLAYQRGAIWDGRGGPWQAIRPLGAMQSILATDLAPLAAIHRGDRVTLVYEKGNIVLSIIVEVLEEGGLGDTILVRNLESRKQIYATVIDQNTVRAK